MLWTLESYPRGNEWLARVGDGRDGEGKEQEK
jgi:hypothetical protein